MSLVAEKRRGVVLFCPLLQWDISQGCLRSQVGFWVQMLNRQTEADPCLVARAGQGVIAGQCQQCNDQAWPHIYYTQLQEQ